MQSQVNESMWNPDTATQIVDAIAPAVESTANSVAEATYGLAHAAGEGVDELSERGQAALGAYRGAVAARPLRAVGVAVLAGIVLGALLRR